MEHPLLCSTYGSTRASSESKDDSSEPFHFAGSVAAAANFPAPAAVSVGDVYIVTADCIDNAGAGHTNTGQAFLAGAEIAWNGATWTELGTQKGIVVPTASPVAVGEGEQQAEKPFSTVCVSGKIVNAYNALLMAQKMSKK